MKTVTLFIKFVIVMGQFELGEIFDRFRNGYYEKIITSLRKMLEAGDLKGFNEGKSKLDAVTFCATYDKKRTPENRTGYNSLIIIDADHISDSDMPKIKEKLRNCDCVLSFFVSPSGHGLKILVPVSTGDEDHLPAFNSVAQFFELQLGIKIDRSGSDIPRLCYVTHDPEIYVNWNAKIFDPYMGLGKPVYPPKPVGPVLKADNVVDPLQAGETINELYMRCIEYTKRFHQYIEGQRNIFVYILAGNLCKAGLLEHITLDLLLKDFNFDDREVRNCVKSAYVSNFADMTPGRNVIYNPVLQTNTDPENDVPAADRSARRKAEREKKKKGPTGVPADQTALPDAVNPAQTDIQPEKKKKIQGPQYTFDEVEAYIRANYETRNNVVSGRIEWRFAHTNTPFLEMDDIVVNSLFCDLHHLGQFIPVNTLYLLLNSKFSSPINPFIAYFNGLAPWDGVTDYIGQLADTVKTHDKNHWDICLRKWIVAFAAGMIVDNIINHTVIVLIGDQGIGKTTFIRRILPQALSDYLGTSTMLSDNKDTSIQLSECGLIILDEIESLTKKELAALKEFLTRVNVHIRKPFAHFTVNLVRRASVICSLNREDLLTDTTGSRRFLCFKVSEIDYQHTVDMDGVMAQAFALYKSGFRYWMNKTDISVINKHNERFYAKSVEQEMIETWVRPVTREEWDNRNQFASDSNIKLLSSTQIAGEIMVRLHVQITDFSINKIGRILVKLGYECVVIRGKTLYIVRVLDGESVARNNRTMDDEAVMLNEQEENDQYIRFEEDLAGGKTDDDLPF